MMALFRLQGNKMSNNYKIYFLFLIGIAIGYGIGYKQVMDIMSIKNSNVEQINEVIMHYENILNKTQSTFSNFNKKHSDFLVKLDGLLKTNNQHISSTDVLINKNEPIELKDYEKNQCAEITKNIDFKNVESLVADVQSTDFSIRRRALAALLLLGSADIKQQINHIIENEKEDITLRGDLIKLTDWQGLSSDLVRLIDSTDSSEIKTAAIQSAQVSQFSDNEKQVIDEKLAQIFIHDNDDSVRINALDYFANTASDKLTEVVKSLSKQEITPDVQKRIDLLSISFPEIKESIGSDSEVSPQISNKDYL